MGIAVPPDRPITADDFFKLPEGPPYYELLDGELVMNASPNAGHQIIIGNLHLLLHGACPAGLRVMLSPFDWRADDHNVFEPDLLVARRDDLTARAPFTETPLLCVEVLSPSGKPRDRVRKRVAYERAGVASYWIVDPDGPRILVLALSGGRYVEVADTTQPVELARPFPVTVDPARLLD